MYTAKRPSKRPAITFFILASLFVGACGTQVQSVNWPGLSSDGEVVYVAYGPGVIAYDVESQEQLWSFPLEANPSLQFYAPPAVDGERIVIGDYGAAGGMFSPQVTVSLYALDKAGAPNTEWVADELAHDRIIAPPTLVGDHVLVGTADNELLVLDAEDGSLRWPFETGHSIWAQPIEQDGVVYVASLDKTVYALDGESGDVIWERALDGSIASGPVYAGGLIYVGSFDKQLHALDAASGEERWAAPAEDWVWASPAVSGDTLIYADISGNVYGVGASSGEQRWHQPIGGVIQATPLVVDGTVYIATAMGDEGTLTRGALVALDAGDGSEQWREETSGPLFTSPVTAGDRVVVALQSPEALLITFALDGSDRQTFTPATEE